MDELRDLMLAEMNGDQPAPKQDDPLRGSDGRFVSPAGKEQATPAADEEVVYQRTIDLGDGAGVQVFEGKTMEELIDNLAKAQEHATRKIREQAAALKAKPAPLPQISQEKELTADEKWLLQQRMAQDPTAVINEFVQREVQKVTQAQQEATEAAQRAAAEQEQLTTSWVESNPDYYGSPKNGKRIEQFLKLEGLELTPENLTKAFTELSADGLLEARPAESNNAKTEDEAAPVVRRIVEQQAPVTTTVRRKVVGSVSTKRSAPVELTVPGLTEKQLYEMPFEQLEQILYRSAR